MTITMTITRLLKSLLHFESRRALTLLMFLLGITFPFSGIKHKFPLALTLGGAVVLETHHIHCEGRGLEIGVHWKTAGRTVDSSWNPPALLPCHPSPARFSGLASGSVRQCGELWSQCSHWWVNTTSKSAVQWQWYLLALWCPFLYVGIGAAW